MDINVEQLRQVMLEAGIEPELAGRLQAGEPLILQGIDSLDFPAFALAVENHYAISITDHDLLSLRTLDDFVAFIIQKTT